MAPREDIITSAVTFLQDPSVASSPVEKRIEFLRSKNLTEEEVQLSLARAADPSTPSQPQSQYYPPQQQYGRPPPQGFGYNYNPYADFQAAPPEPPKRDWRDWFIMATVVSGATYGLYILADRYVKPLILPPTPPQLEQDKAAIDEQFNRAFALIDTLASDTTALKAAEEARTLKLDSVLADVEAVVAELKSANTRREDDARRMAEDITRLKDSLPTAMDGVKQSSERQLKELSTELASLKTLMGNRMSGAPSSSAYLPSASSLRDKTTSAISSQQPSVTTEPTPGSSGNITGSSPATTIPAYGLNASSAARPIPTSSRSSQFASTSSYGVGSASAGKAAIPAWQMAAQSKAKEPAPTNGDSTGTGTGTDGADAVAALSAS
jgi:peroxin-14